MTDTASTTRPAWVDDELFPFESHFIEIDGHTVHYVDEGSGPTLLMLHGNPTWSFLFREVIRLLRNDFRCIALDYPGFGLSTPRPGYRYLPEEHAEVVTAFVDALDLKDVTLIGQDWGGMIGLAFATRNPGVVKRLVVLNTAGFGLPEGRSLPWQIAMVRYAPFFPLPVRGFNATKAPSTSSRGCKARGRLSCSPLTRVELRLCRSSTSHTSPAAYTAACSRLHRSSWRQIWLVGARPRVYRVPGRSG